MNARAIRFPRLLVPALVVGLLTAPAQADEPKVLFVPHTTMPFQLRTAIVRAYGSRADIVSNDAYLALCRRADLSPWSLQCIRRYGVRAGADVIVVGSWLSWGRSRVIRMTYRDGDDGRVLLQTRHTLPGVRLDRAARVALAREIVMTGGLAGEDGGAPARNASNDEPEEGGEERAAASEEESSDEGGLPPPVNWDEDEEPAAGEAEALEEGDDAEDAAGDSDGEASPIGRRAGFAFEAQAGFGFGARASAVPMEAGPARLSTSPFPAAALGLGAAWWGESVHVAARARYFTSVGLRTKDIRSDGSTRTVDARSHSLALGLAVGFALGDRAGATVLELGIGYHFRLFDAEVPLSMPEYTLSGVYARADLSFPVGSGPLRLAIAPEVGSVNGITEQLQETGKVTTGVMVGAEAAVRFQLLEELQLEVVYRESHAFMPSERDSDMTDVERFGVLRATYIP